jgi:hypothetical protein
VTPNPKIFVSQQVTCKPSTLDLPQISLQRARGRRHFKSGQVRNQGLEWTADGIPFQPNDQRQWHLWPWILLARANMVASDILITYLIECVSDARSESGALLTSAKTVRRFPPHILLVLQVFEMKIGHGWVLLVVVTLCSCTSSVLGKLAVRIVFNRGQTESHKWCSASDWTKVQIALDVAAQRRRLGASAHVSRQLTFCAAICQFFAPRTCYLSGTGCRNRRALSLESTPNEASLLPAEPDDTMDTHRHLFADHECAEKKNRLVNGLNSVQNNVDQTCRNLIISQHDLTCYDV